MHKVRNIQIHIVIRKSPLCSSGNSQLNAKCHDITKKANIILGHTRRNIACNIYEAILLFYSVVLEVSAEVQRPLKVLQLTKEVA